MNLTTARLIALALLAFPQPASAHPVFSGVEGFYGGLLHPLFVPAHSMAVLGVAALIAQQQAKWHWPKHWPAPISFILGLAAGSAAIASAYAPTYSNEAVVACATIAGVLLALGMPLSTILVAILAAATGIALALDSPPDVISIREAILIQLGTFCGASILLLAVIEIVARRRFDWQRIGIRIVGSWIAASAILVLALRLAR